MSELNDCNRPWVFFGDNDGFFHIPQAIEGGSIFTRCDDRVSLMDLLAITTTENARNRCEVCARDVDGFNDFDDFDSFDDAETKVVDVPLDTRFDHGGES